MKTVEIYSTVLSVVRTVTLALYLKVLHLLGPKTEADLEKKPKVVPHKLCNCSAMKLFNFIDDKYSVMFSGPES